VEMSYFAERNGLDQPAHSIVLTAPVTQLRDTLETFAPKKS